MVHDESHLKCYVSLLLPQDGISRFWFVTAAGSARVKAHFTFEKDILKKSERLLLSSARAQPAVLAGEAAVAWLESVFAACSL